MGVFTFAALKQADLTGLRVPTDLQKRWLRPSPLAALVFDGLIPARSVLSCWRGHRCTCNESACKVGSLVASDLAENAGLDLIEVSARGSVFVFRANAPRRLDIIAKAGPAFQSELGMPVPSKDDT